MKEPAFACLLLLPEREREREREKWGLSKLARREKNSCSRGCNNNTGTHTPTPVDIALFHNFLSLSLSLSLCLSLSLSFSLTSRLLSAEPGVPRGLSLSKGAFDSSKEPLPLSSLPFLLPGLSSKKKNFYRTHNYTYPPHHQQHSHLPSVSSPPPKKI